MVTLDISYALNYRCQRRTILRESTSTGVKNIQELKLMALNRPGWRTMVSAVCAANGTGGPLFLISMSTVFGTYSYAYINNDQLISLRQLP